MSEGESHGIDRAIVMGLRGAGDPSNPIGPHWFAVIARDVTALGGVAVLSLVSLAVLAYVLLRACSSCALRPGLSPTRERGSLHS